MPLRFCRRLTTTVLILLLAFPATGAPPQMESDLAWQSVATGVAIKFRLLQPSPRELPENPQPLIVYLANLAAPRAGTETDAAILQDFRNEGFLVATLDYEQHPRSRWPHLNRDIVELRAQLHARKFPHGVEVDQARIYVVPSGHRLLRDVVYYEDGARRLAMDVIYPAKPRTPVGVALEFSCDNTDRMGNFSLQFCTDSLLEGAASAGFAVAMADHPVAAPYKGLDPMPDSQRKVHAATRTLRSLSPRLGLNGRVVTIGFSRGSGMALLAATTGTAQERVDGAVVLSGRFSYLDLLPDDPMIPRYARAWGPRDAHEETWRTHGAIDHLTKPTVPLFLSINATESPHALHQMKVLRERLAELNSPFQYFPESTPRGHRMPIDADVLVPLLAYLNRRLSPGSANL